MKTLTGPGSGKAKNYSDPVLSELPYFDACGKRKKDF